MSPLSYFPTPPLSHFPTFPLSHFLTFSLSHFLTFSLSHFLTFPLSHFLTFSLSHFLTSPLCQYPTSRRTPFCLDAFLLRRLSLQAPFLSRLIFSRAFVICIKPRSHFSHWMLDSHFLTFSLKVGLPLSDLNYNPPPPLAVWKEILMEEADVCCCAYPMRAAPYLPSDFVTLSDFAIPSDPSPWPCDCRRLWHWAVPRGLCHFQKMSNPDGNIPGSE